MGQNTIDALMIGQIVISAILVVLVLLQNRSDGLGSMFGGGGGEVFRTKRGMEKVLHRLTILLSILVCVISLVLVKYSN